MAAVHFFAASSISWTPPLKKINLISIHGNRYDRDCVHNPFRESKTHKWRVVGSPRRGPFGNSHCSLHRTFASHCARVGYSSRASDRSTSRDRDEDKLSTDGRQSSRIQRCCRRLYYDASALTWSLFHALGTLRGAEQCEDDARLRVDTDCNHHHLAASFHHVRTWKVIQITVHSPTRISRAMLNE